VVRFEKTLFETMVVAKLEVNVVETFMALDSVIFVTTRMILSAPVYVEVIKDVPVTVRVVPIMSIERCVPLLLIPVVTIDPEVPKAKVLVLAAVATISLQVIV